MHLRVLANQSLKAPTLWRVLPGSTIVWLLWESLELLLMMQKDLTGSQDKAKTASLFRSAMKCVQKTCSR